MSARLNRRGATLPLTIIVIALLGVSVAIAYARLSSERRITGDAQAQVNALAVAQTGLSRYLAGLNGMPPTTHDTTITGLPGGTAQISLRRLRDSTTTLLPAVFVITSRGTNTTAKRYSSAAVPAERTVATYALWTPAPIDVDAGITSLSGLTLNGTSATLSGNDNCGAAAAIPGVAVPNGGYTGAAAPIDGNPDNTAVGLGTGGAGGSAKDQVSIDWAGIVAGTTLPANYVYPAWPTAAQFNNWPVVRVNNSGGSTFDLPGGQGILIVTGDLNFGGTGTWNGLVLVGGAFTSNGNNQIYGATIAGLNVKLGQTVPVSSIANGNKTYQYDSCALARALGKIGSLQRVRNGWTDTWSSY